MFEFFKFKTIYSKDNVFKTKEPVAVAQMVIECVILNTSITSINAKTIRICGYLEPIKSNYSKGLEVQNILCLIKYVLLS